MSRDFVSQYKWICKYLFCLCPVLSMACGLSGTGGLSIVDHMSISKGSCYRFHTWAMPMLCIGNYLDTNQAVPKKFQSRNLVIAWELSINS